MSSLTSSPNLVLVGGLEGRKERKEKDRKGEVGEGEVKE